MNQRALTSHLYKNAYCSKKFKRDNGFNEQAGYWMCDICNGPGEYLTLDELNKRKKRQCGKIDPSLTGTKKGRANIGQPGLQGHPDTDDDRAGGRVTFHSNDKKWHCNHCIYSNKKQFKVYLHLKTAHEVDTNWRKHRYVAYFNKLPEGTGWTCKECNNPRRKFTTLNAIAIHVALKHEIDNIPVRGSLKLNLGWECASCGVPFMERQSICKHVKRCQGIPDPTPQTKPKRKRNKNIKKGQVHQVSNTATPNHNQGRANCATTSHENRTAPLVDKNEQTANTPENRNPRKEKRKWNNQQVTSIKKNKANPPDRLSPTNPTYHAGATLPSLGPSRMAPWHRWPRQPHLTATPHHTTSQMMLRPQYEDAAHVAAAAMNEPEITTELKDSWGNSIPLQ
jgi:rubredoxin